MGQKFKQLWRDEPDGVDERSVHILNSLDRFEELRGQPEIAVDLEGSIRSGRYHQRTCLIQVSTRSTDYVFDVANLEHPQSQLKVLKEVMEDPNIVKVSSLGLKTIVGPHKS